MPTATVPTESAVRRRLTLLLAVLALVASACGGLADETDAAAPSDDLVFDSGDETTAPSAGAATVAPETDTTPDDTEAPDDAPVDPQPTPDKPVDDGDNGAKELVALNDSVLSQAIRGEEAAAVAPASGRFDGRIEIVALPGAEMPSMSIGFSGAFDERVPSSHISMDMSDMFEAMMADPEMAGAGEDEAFLAMFAAMFAEPIEVIQVGDRAWMSGSMMAWFAPDAAGKWIETDAGEIDADEMNIGMDFVDPDEILGQFADGYGTITEVGTEVLRGVTTTHYRVVVDAEALAAGMDPGELAEFEQDFGDLDGLTELPFDIWIGDDGLTRKFSMELDAAAMGDDADAEDIESVSMVFEMWDYGTDVGITPPPAELIITEDELGAGFFGE